MFSKTWSNILRDMASDLSNPRMTVKVNCLIGTETEIEEISEASRWLFDNVLSFLGALMYVFRGNSKCADSTETFYTLCEDGQFCV